MQSLTSKFEAWKLAEQEALFAEHRRVQELLRSTLPDAEAIRRCTMDLEAKQRTAHESFKEAMLEVEQKLLSLRL